MSFCLIMFNCYCSPAEAESVTVEVNTCPLGAPTMLACRILWCNRNLTPSWLSSLPVKGMASFTNNKALSE